MTNNSLFKLYIRPKPNLTNNLTDAKRIVTMVFNTSSDSKPAITPFRNILNMDGSGKTGSASEVNYVKKNLAQK